MARKIKLVAMGSSTGGVEALSAILPKLNPPFPPIVIVQHIPAGFSKLFADRMNRESIIGVKEAEDGEIIQPDWAYIAPGGFHMKLVKFGNDLKIKCFMAPPVHSCRPAVDILFFSVAELVGAAALGVILTGIGHDGAAGLLEMKKQGAVTLGQDETTSAVYGMPKSAFECGAVMRQLALSAMPLAITSIANKVKNFEELRTKQN